MNTSQTLKNYLDELSSNSPTPGGGNVAALCGALASSLGEMVCNLSIGKKKYADFEDEASMIKLELEKTKEKFLDLADLDNEAFNRVMSAFKLPKDTEQLKNERTKAIQEATWGAAEVPAKVIKLCGEALPFIQTVAKKGNQNSLSDAGVAASLIFTAAQGALLNVMINCSGLTDQITANEFLKRHEIIFSEVKLKSQDIVDSIMNKLRTE